MGHGYAAPGRSGGLRDYSGGVEVLRTHLYELDLEGVHQTVFRRRRVIPWTAIRSCEMAAAGVLLLPNADAVPLDAWIGLYLPWSGRREEVLANLVYYLGKQSDVDARV